MIFRSRGRSEAFMAFHFGDAAACIALPAEPGVWEKEFDSADERWLGGCSLAPARLEGGPQPTFTLAAKSFVVYKKMGVLQS